jgi:hypothetical protein
LSPIPWTGDRCGGRGPWITDAHVLLRRLPAAKRPSGSARTWSLLEQPNPDQAAGWPRVTGKAAAALWRYEVSLLTAEVEAASQVMIDGIEVRMTGGIAFAWRQDQVELVSRALGVIPTALRSAGPKRPLIVMVGKRPMALIMPMDPDVIAEKMKAL